MKRIRNVSSGLWLSAGVSCLLLLILFCKPVGAEEANVVHLSGSLLPPIKTYISNNKPFINSTAQLTVPATARVTSATTVSTTPAIIGTTVITHTIFLPMVDNRRFEITQIATSPALPEVIVTLAKHGDRWLPLFYSQDSGATWNQVATTPDYAKSIRVYVSIVPRADQTVRIILAVRTGRGRGLYRTGDYGQAWAEEDLPEQVSYYDNMVTSSVQPTDVYLSTSNLIGTIPPSVSAQLFLSHDSGLTWEKILTSSFTGIWDVLPSPAEGASIYAAPWGWVKSEDGGESWTRMDTPAPFLQLDATDPNILYTLGMRSTDGGVTWVDWEEQPDSCTQLLAHPAESETLFARCAQGVYCSSNAGDTWHQIQTTSGDLLTVDFSIQNAPRVLVTHSNEIWASSGGCSEFTYISSLP